VYNMIHLGQNGIKPTACTVRGDGASLLLKGACEPRYSRSHKIAADGEDAARRTRQRDQDATGKVIGKCYSRHRAAEFRKFLDEIEAAVPRGLDVHLVMDNDASHKAPLIRNWLAKRPRWHVHLTPTSSSWLNQVEHFFAFMIAFMASVTTVSRYDRRRRRTPH
jgi:transposase